MPIPDWRKLVLDKTVLVEPVSDPGRIILWVRREQDNGCQYWERISTVPRAEVSVVQGIGATAATSLRVRQRRLGLLGRLFRRWRRPTGEENWVLPDGSTAEQCGARETNLLLAWPEDETTPLDQGRVQTRWPQTRRLQQLGPNLFLVAAVESPEVIDASDQPQALEEPPVEAAERLLSAARQAGNHQAEAAALTDLGVLYLHHKDPERAVAILEEALTLVRRLEDRAGEIDTLGNLGQAKLTLGQAQRAQELCEQAVMLARDTGNRIAEKIALERLALAYVGLRDHTQAILFYEQALFLARMLGDRQHEADMLWQLGILHAEQGRREQAIHMAQAAVNLLEKMGHPQAASLANHLKQYRRGTGRTVAVPAGEAGRPFNGPSSASAEYAGQTPSGASLPHRAMAPIPDSGRETVSAETHQERLRICGACEHHTGLRCRLCGCFTSAKAWRLHEECPLNKWRNSKP